MGHWDIGALFSTRYKGHGTWHMVHGTWYVVHLGHGTWHMHMHMLPYFHQKSP